MRKRFADPAVRASLPMASQNFDVEEAAAVLGIGRTRVFSLIASGALKSVRIGRSRLIPGAVLQRYLDDLAKRAA